MFGMKISSRNILYEKSDNFDLTFIFAPLHIKKEETDEQKNQSPPTQEIWARITGNVQIVNKYSAWRLGGVKYTKLATIRASKLVKKIGNH